MFEYYPENEEGTSKCAFVGEEIEGNGIGIRSQSK